MIVLQALLRKHFAKHLSWFDITAQTTTAPSTATPLLILPSQPTLPSTPQAWIQFERTSEHTALDPRIDAVLHHVCNLPEVRSLRFNGIEFIPNFEGSLKISDDIWFEVIQR